MKSENIFLESANENMKAVQGGGFTLISAKLHRGEKWTERQNTIREDRGQEPDLIPCTESFGICNVKIGNQEEVVSKNLKLQSMSNLEQSV